MTRRLSPPPLSFPPRPVPDRDAPPESARARSSTMSRETSRRRGFEIPASPSPRASDAGVRDAREGTSEDAARAKAWALSGLTPPDGVDGGIGGDANANANANVRDASSPALGSRGSFSRSCSGGGVSALSDSLRRIDSGLLFNTDETGAGGLTSAGKKKLMPDDFDILKLVGQGAFGKVFQVRKKDSGGIYAMKVMKKDRIIEKDQAEYTKAERDILTAVTHPFIVSLRFSFQTTSKLYLILEFINGGHLFFQLYQQGTFGDDLTRFYISEICLAIGHLHSLNIMHRDLKPENILVDVDGHVKITDFGLAKKISEDERANSLAGSIDYMAPEILNARGHGKTADWWSVGVLMFEMLAGTLPFKGKNKQAVQKAICSEKVKVPNYFQPEAVGLIKGMLAKDPTVRLGRGENGTADVKGHKYFKSVNWEKIAAKAVPPPFKPNVNGRHCTANFDARWTDVDPVDSLAATPVSGEQHKFTGFTYVSNFMEEAMSKLENVNVRAGADDKDGSGSDEEGEDGRNTLDDTLDELDLSEDESAEKEAPSTQTPAMNVQKPPKLRPDAPAFVPGR